MKEEKWDIEIKPKDRMLAIDFKEMWRYRDLFVLFVRRDISTAYKQTVLGPLWWIISPVLSMIVMVAVFGGIVGIPTDGVPATLFYLLGPAVWSYFSTCLTATSNSFVANSGIFGKVYFPRMIMPFVSITTNLVPFLVQMLIFASFYIYYVATGLPLAPNWIGLLFPFLMVMLALLAAGFGMVVSSMTTKYRDLQMGFAFVVNLWMYVTPVIYPLSMVKEPKLYTLMSLNPVTPIVEAIKFGLLGTGSFSWLWLGYSFVFMVVALAIGIVVFNRTQKSFMDTV